MARRGAFNRDLESKSAGDKQGGTSFPSMNLHSDYNTPLVRGIGGWQLHRAIECRLARRLEGLEIGLSAKHWLQTYRRDPFAMTAMREVLLAEDSSQPVNRWREIDVIDQVAHLLKSGHWHVCEPVMQIYPITLSKESAQSVSAPVPRKASRSSEPPPPVSEVPDQATLAGNADQAAIAAALTLAAAGGIPFCEECTKAALG